MLMRVGEVGAASHVKVLRPEEVFPRDQAQWRDNKGLQRQAVSNTARARRRVASSTVLALKQADSSTVQMPKRVVNNMALLLRRTASRPLQACNRGRNNTTDRIPTQQLLTRIGTQVWEWQRQPELRLVLPQHTLLDRPPRRWQGLARA